MGSVRSNHKRSRGFSGRFDSPSAGGGAESFGGTIEDDVMNPFNTKEAIM